MYLQIGFQGIVIYSGLHTGGLKLLNRQNEEHHKQSDPMLHRRLEEQEQRDSKGIIRGEFSLQGRGISVDCWSHLSIFIGFNKTNESMLGSGSTHKLPKYVHEKPHATKPI